ncbi:MAG: TIGR03619 family F420-dependent LLM class oxidoreductase [Gammaproteobacteria bacterium]|jgi:probable F420-dependent oxidoreductase|nr:TIGR03619 family F420-dependent LLM class oxidoreductase [Gammaproteobacteria bacterium]MBT5202023.1 TIGR03619 family F420-dependent LLM class oxidoreductase [Gammaproteobacteria bacterium]MBT5600748.1 TIGR03619 family F420-dependent LLM class oxidoreductase [Gammaproteobacteria bacterium]MBT6243921.1 TIGR03619 family F420-dependent LLM class oxidoreductase [Gammaproteobacteria bacterium]
MDIGVTIRNMGPESTADMVVACAREAEDQGIESLWITDHIAIPPNDAEGSGGRYLDTLTTLAWLGGATRRIKLGSGVLILPYRPMLPTAKQIATIQELTKNRLVLGIGIGWMDPEFKALGIDRHQRGRITDDTLQFLNECFAKDEVSLNEQSFLFKPRPQKPPILIGGNAPQALHRAARYADGWIPMARDPQQLQTKITTYQKLTDDLGKPRGNITVMTSLPLNEPDNARRLLAEYEKLGADRLVCNLRYHNADVYRDQLKKLTDVSNR